jgi:UDP-glucose 4-epimerase
MNILVTGNGFIGKALTKRLIELGHNVVTVDKIWGADHQFDISVYDNFQQLYNTPIDVIYHTAGQSYGHRSMVEPELDVDWNVKGTLNVCRFAKHMDVKKIIYTSTMAVYGEGECVNEEAELNPLSNYALSKLYGEYCLKSYSQYGIDYTIFRVFNTYGAGQNLHVERQGVVAAFANQVVRGNTIKVTGSLDRYRSLIYIDDNINALLLGLKKDTNGEVYNLCRMNKITIGNIIKTLIENSGRDEEEFDIQNIGSPDGDQFGCTGNNEKLRLLDWKPTISIEKGIELFYKYAEDTING